jgi:hypothetical protein
MLVIRHEHHNHRPQKIYKPIIQIILVEVSVQTKIIRVQLSYTHNQESRLHISRPWVIELHNPEFQSLNGQPATKHHKKEMQWCTGSLRLIKIPLVTHCWNARLPSIQTGRHEEDLTGYKAKGHKTYSQRTEEGIKPQYIKCKVDQNNASGILALHALLSPQVHKT